MVHGILQARILEWVAFPFSRGSSQPRDRTQVSLIAGGFFTNRVSGKLYRDSWLLAKKRAGFLKTEVRGVGLFCCFFFKQREKSLIFKLGIKL